MNKEWKHKGIASSVAEVVAQNMNVPVKNLYTKDYICVEHPITNLDVAADRIKNTEKDIEIISDYDVDGILSSVALYLILSALGKKFHIHVPKRFSEGYGVSDKIVKTIPDNCLVITIDNGISAVSQIAQLKEKGCEVIVLDHHLPGKELPPADCIVDTFANNDEFNGYCGTSLAYRLGKIIFGNNRELLRNLRSLAAIATVTDCMDLRDENRGLVRAGMEDLTQTTIPGLKLLLEALKLTDYVNEGDIGFKIGPALNAPGRLYDNGGVTVLKTLCTENGAFVQKVLEINEERKQDVADSMILIEQYIAENKLHDKNPICIYIPRLKEGIVGILAGKVAEKYSANSIVLTDSSVPDIIKGSARGIGDIHLKKHLDRYSQYMTGYGGHEKAAGMSLKKNDFLAFSQALQIPKTTKEPTYDLEIDAKDIPQYIWDILTFGPYGEGNPQLIFKINNFKLMPKGNKFYDLMKGIHIKLFGEVCEAVWFDGVSAYREMGEPKTLNLIGKLSMNHYMGREKMSVEILDAEPVQRECKNEYMMKILEMSKSRRGE